MGLDVAYLKVDGASTTSGQVLGGAVVPNGAINSTVGFKNLSDEGIWMARFRVHRDFYP
jgi:hypothetical protein